MNLRMTVKGIFGEQELPFLDSKTMFLALFFPEAAQESLEKSCVSNHLEKHVQPSHDTIEADFEELQKTLGDVPSQNIVNYDKINLTKYPGRRKMIYIFKRVCRYPERIINGTKASTSIMLAGTVSGKILPLYTVYKSHHLWSTWMEGGHPKAIYNRTKSGWFNHMCFVDWYHTARNCP